MKTVYFYKRKREARNGKQEIGSGKREVGHRSREVGREKWDVSGRSLALTNIKSYFLTPTSYFLTIFLTVISFFASSPAMADGQWMHRSETVQETVAISNTATVEITNKYGRIQIDTWDKDSLSIEVNITAQARNFDKVERIMNKINIDMNTDSEDFMIFRTEIGNGKRRGGGILSFFQDLWDDTSDLTSSLLNTQNVTVDYRLYMPESVKLTIENKFGDVILPTMKGALRMDIEHGDLRAQEIWNARNVKAKYGKLDVKNIRQGNLTLSFVDAVIESGGSLQVESRSSNINLEEVESLEVDAHYDEWYIGSAENVNGSQVSTDLRVRNLSNSIDLTSKYGSVDVAHVEPKVKSVNLYGNYTDYSLSFNPSVSYNFNVTLKDKDSFYFPEKQADIDTDDISEEGMRHIDGRMKSSKESYDLTQNQNGGKGTDVRIKTKNGSVHMSYSK
ncbi:MAG: hypothetical protein ACPGVB_02045 [Chitinophagales bacterium]